MTAYEPSTTQLERYARVLIDFALGGGKGISPGDVVLVIGPEHARPLFQELRRAVWRSGGHVISQYETSDDQLEERFPEFYELASDEQLKFFPEKYFRGLIDETDHLVAITSPVDPLALADVPPEKIMRHNARYMPLISWQQDEGERRRAHLDGRAVRHRGDGGRGPDAARGVLAADHQRLLPRRPRPDRQLAAVAEQIDEHCALLNSLPIARLHVEGEDADLWLTLGERRRWMGGGGATSRASRSSPPPDWRGTEGRIRFSEPLYSTGR